MRTKVFLSWSGDLSRQAAEIFKGWLEIVIQELDVFYSEDDIAKGTNGIKTIFSNLQESVASVIMLTKENQTSPWICFEAGAMLSKQDANACGILLDFGIDELEGPLKNLQQTTLIKKDVLKLLKTLNSKCSTQLSEDKLKRAFDSTWEKLYKDLTHLIQTANSDGATKSTSAKLAAKTSYHTSKKNILVEQKQKMQEQFSRDLEDNYDNIVALLKCALTYNNKDCLWSSRLMMRVLNVTRSQIELLIDLCIKGRFISKSFDISSMNSSDPYVYKITPEGTSMINQIMRTEKSLKKDK